MVCVVAEPFTNMNSRARTVISRAVGVSWQAVQKMSRADENSRRRSNSAVAGGRHLREGAELTPGKPQLEARFGRFDLTGRRLAWRPGSRRASVARQAHAAGR